MKSSDGQINAVLTAINGVIETAYANNMNSADMCELMVRIAAHISKGYGTTQDQWNKAVAQFFAEAPEGFSRFDTLNSH